MSAAVDSPTSGEQTGGMPTARDASDEPRGVPRGEPRGVPGLLVLLGIVVIGLGSGAAYYHYKRPRLAAELQAKIEASPKTPEGRLEQWHVFGETQIHHRLSQSVDRTSNPLNREPWQAPLLHRVAASIHERALDIDAEPVAIVPRVEPEEYAIEGSRPVHQASIPPAHPAVSPLPRPAMSSGWRAAVSSSSMRVASADATRRPNRVSP